MMRGKLTLSTVAGVMTFIAATSVPPPSAAADQTGARTNGRATPASIERLRLSTPQTTASKVAQIDPALLRTTGPQKVLVRLRSASVAASGASNPADQIMLREQIKLEQSAFVERTRRAAPGTRVTSDVQTVLNAVVMEVDAAGLRQIAKDPFVLHVSRVVDYRMDLSETVPYITAKQLQDVRGVKGKGIRVAVLDSGIDYTHAAFGGAGTAAAYEAAFGSSTSDSRNTTRDGLFPTARVVAGYDFVGEAWPSGDLAPDDDPIDCGAGGLSVGTCAGGHGTHVADIIGGAQGVAPEVSLYAVKVCSAVSTSCSGEALIQGMEYATDPNGDGSSSDRVHIINMSLGSPYGQPFDDDLVAAVESASKLGILTVASAGNSGDKPYVTGTPGGAPSALSVAQTAVPGAFQAQYEVTAPTAIAGLYPAVFQPWSVPLVATVQAPLQYANGAGGNADGCAAFPSGSLAGKIVLVDRGACNFSLKVKNVGDAGGLIGIIGLIAPGDPFEGSFGGDAPQAIPGYMIGQAASNLLKANLASGVTMRFDPSLGVPLAMSMVGSSSRGPSNYYSAIKPEIGAPGASVSAVAGSGNGTVAFGGTSGAAPMVTGAAALIRNAYPSLKPHEIKARLMNNAERNIFTDALTGRLAEITRIGNGEVRVFDAWKDPAAAWDQTTLSGALSFGQLDVSQTATSRTRNVQVRNYSNSPIVYKVRSSFRFADDQALGAVKIQVPSTITVPANGSVVLPVKMVIYGEKLRENAMNSGSQGANPATLTYNEIDGYLDLEAGNQSRLHLAWQILPRKAAQVTGTKALKFDPSGIANAALTNTGVGTARNDAYSLLGVSPNLPAAKRGKQMPTPDLRAVGINTFLDSGCESGFIWAFAINTWERQTHLAPVQHVVSLDINRDGTDDYWVYNSDLLGSTLGDGRQATFVQAVGSITASAYFFVEHVMNTANTVLYMCGEQAGLTNADILATNVDMRVDATDYYFGGPGDAIEGLTVTPLGERYYGLPDDIAGFGTGNMPVYDFGLFPGNTDEIGVLLFTNGRNGGATKDTEAKQFNAP